MPKKAKNMSESQMREAEVRHIESRDELIAYIDSLLERNHDYGTAVYAMSMAATAAFYYAAYKVGASGFQASCADLDILRRTRGYELGFKVIDFSNLLYPQYCNDDQFPGWQHFIKERANNLADAATKKLVEHKKKKLSAHDAVVEHWKKLAAFSWGRPDPR